MALGEASRGRQVGLLGDLYGSLAALGVDVQLRDAIPSLTVKVDSSSAYPCVGVYVFVSPSGEDFVWRTADSRHPIGDIEGAVRRIVELAEFVRPEDQQVFDEPGPVSGSGS